MTDAFTVHIESGMFRDAGDPQDGGAAFTVIGLHLWELGSDIYGAFDLNNTMQIALSAYLYEDTGPILGFQENTAELNLGVLSHIRTSELFLRQLKYTKNFDVVSANYITAIDGKSIDSKPREAVPNGVLVAVDIELQDEKFISEGVNTVQLSFSVVAAANEVVSSSFVTFDPLFEERRKPIVWMNLTSYFLVPREAVPGLFPVVFSVD